MIQVEQYIKKQTPLQMLLTNKEKFHIFDGMRDADIILIIKFVNFKSFNKGEVIIKENDSAQAIYFILSGECDAMVSDNIVGKLTPNTIVGEISGISTGLRQATVVATTDLQVIELLISYDKFEQYIVPFSYFYRNITMSLIQKITEANAQK